MLIEQTKEAMRVGFHAAFPVFPLIPVHVILECRDLKVILYVDGEGVEDFTLGGRWQEVHNQTGKPLGLFSAKPRGTGSEPVPNKVGYELGTRQQLLIAGKHRHVNEPSRPPHCEGGRVGRTGGWQQIGLTAAEHRARPLLTSCGSVPTAAARQYEPPYRCIEASS